MTGGVHVELGASPDPGMLSQLEGMASVVCASRLIEPKDMAPVEKRYITWPNLSHRTQPEVALAGFLWFEDSHKGMEGSVGIPHREIIIIIMVVTKVKKSVSLKPERLMNLKIKAYSFFAC